MNHVVTVLTPTGHRQNVKCLPNQTLLQILNEVCTKFKLPPGNYDLTHHRRVLDLSLMFRFAGLPNNAQLEMCEAVRKRVDEDVTLMLQLENGSRIPGQFKPDQTISEILAVSCPAGVAHSGPNVVCVYMRTEIHGDSLSTTTLRSLGLTGGRAIMRLIHKDPQTLKTQANVSAPLPVRQVEPQPIRNAVVTPTTVVEESVPQPGPSSRIDKSLDEAMSEEQQMDVDEPNLHEKMSPASPKKLKLDTFAEASSHQPDPSDVIHVLGYRNAIIFNLDAVRATELTVDDSFYDVSVNDLKVLLRDLKCQTQGLDDAPLLTAKMRELDEAKKTLNKLTRYKDTVIRVQFPDRLVLQGTFAAVDSVAAVMEFVREYIIDPHLDFVLFTTPPKQILDPEARLVELQCVPTALLHFGTVVESNVTSFLKAECAAKLSSPSAAVMEAAKFRGLINQNADLSESTSTTSGAHGTSDATKPHLVGGTFKQSSAVAGPSGEVKLPKWFKPTGK